MEWIGASNLSGVFSVFHYIITVAKGLAQWAAVAVVDVVEILFGSRHIKYSLAWYSDFFLCVLLSPSVRPVSEKRPIKKSLSSSDESITATPSWLSVWHKARWEQRRSPDSTLFSQACTWTVIDKEMCKTRRTFAEDCTESVLDLKGMIYLCSFCSCLLLLGGGQSKWGRKVNVSKKMCLAPFNFKENFVLPPHLPLILV